MHTSSDTPLYGLILAGGESRRMGEDKAAIVVDGVPQLQRMVTLLDDIVDQLSVSVRSVEHADALRRGYPLIGDSELGEGPLAGILAALERAPDADWLVVACDLPALDRTSLKALKEAAARQPGSPAIAFASEHNGLPEPLCAIWRRPMIDIIRERLAQRRYCARKCLIVAEVTLLEPVTRGALSNINTPEDRQQWLADRGVAM